MEEIYRIRKATARRRFRIRDLLSDKVMDAAMLDAERSGQCVLN